MTHTRAAFEHWKAHQTFYPEDILETATYHQDAADRLVIWHPHLGVLKTITLKAPEPSLTAP